MELTHSFSTAETRYQPTRPWNLFEDTASIALVRPLQADGEPRTDRIALATISTPNRQPVSHAHEIPNSSGCRNSKILCSVLVEDTEYTTKRTDLLCQHQRRARGCGAHLIAIFADCSEIHQNRRDADSEPPNQGEKTPQTLVQSASWFS
jgi:hypothetical protein